MLNLVYFSISSRRNSTRAHCVSHLVSESSHMSSAALSQLHDGALKTHHPCYTLNAQLRRHDCGVVIPRLEK